MKDRYHELLKEYPAFVSLEQLRVMCHISKRKAKYILDSGIIPSVNSGKKTRKYSIATKDIVSYLRETEEHPGKYIFPSFSSGHRKSHLEMAIPTDNLFTNLLNEYYRKLIDGYPDLLTTSQVHEMTGYSNKHIKQWINEERFVVFQRNGFLFPKSSLIEFISGIGYAMQTPKSMKHKKQLKEILEMYTA